MMVLFDVSMSQSCVRTSYELSAAAYFAASLQTDVTSSVLHKKIKHKIFSVYGGGLGRSLLGCLLISSWIESVNMSTSRETSMCKCKLLEWIRVPHQLQNGRVVYLYGSMQSSIHELALGIELGSQVLYLYTNNIKATRDFFFITEKSLGLVAHSLKIGS